MTPIEMVRGSALFAPHFPRRSDPDAADAASRGIHTGPLVEAVHALAVPGDDAAFALLVELWRTCAVAPVHLAAGQALLAIGTEAALEAVASALDDPSRVAEQLAILAVFCANPAAAFDRFADRFDPARLESRDGADAAARVLAIFAPPWVHPDASEWFADDPRWLSACLAHRRHPRLGPAARDALRYGDPDRVQPALDAALRFEQGPAAHRRASGDLVARYTAGEREAVWRELRFYTAIEGELRDEALAVARETMRRARAALLQLTERLAARGWRPVGGGALLVPPEPGDAVATAEFGHELPPSLAAFWEVVGGVNLIWDYDAEGPPPALAAGVDLPAMDPLAVLPARDAAESAVAWRAEWAEVHPILQEPLAVALAPDRVAKTGVEGGTPHHVELPFAGVDPRFVDGEDDLPFVDYLRHAVRWAGFPALADEDSPAVRAFVAELTAGLEPF